MINSHIKDKHYFLYINLYKNKERVEKRSHLFLKREIPEAVLFYFFESL
jgi:hypothetical protein